MSTLTISKGSPYGAPGRMPDHGGMVVASDAEARSALEAARADGKPFPVLGLTGGDLARTLGGRGELAVTFPIDLGEVLIDGRLHLFVAHLVVRTRTWSYAFVAMNAQWLGPWNLGPRAHPNDGKLDTYLAARLPVADRFKIRSRLPLGAHLPHPAVKEARTAAIQVELPRRLAVVLDGALVGEGQRLSVRVQPDAVTVVV